MNRYTITWYQAGKFGNPGHIYVTADDAKAALTEGFKQLAGTEATESDLNNAVNRYTDIDTLHLEHNNGSWYVMRRK